MNESEITNKILSDGGEILMEAPAKFLNDKELILLALNNLRYLNDHMSWFKPFLSVLTKKACKDKEIVELAVKKSSLNYKYVHKDIRNDKNLLMAAIDVQRRWVLDWNDVPDNQPIFYAPPELQIDDEVLGKAIFKSSKANFFLKKMSRGKQLKVGLEYAKSFKQNFYTNHHSFSYDATKGFDNNVRQTLEMIGRIGIKQFVSLKLDYDKFFLNDKKTLIKLLSNFPKEILDHSFFRKRTQDSRLEREEVLLSILRIEPYAYKCFPPVYKKDENFILRCLENNPLCLKYVAPKYRADEFIILKAITLNPDSFKFAKKSIQKENLLPAIAAIPNLKPNFVLYDLLDADVSNLSSDEKNKIFQFFINRVDEKDIFILAKAKKRLFQ